MKLFNVNAAAKCLAFAALLAFGLNAAAQDVKQADKKETCCKKDNKKCCKKEDKKCCKKEDKKSCKKGCMVAAANKVVATKRAATRSNLAPFLVQFALPAKHCINSSVGAVFLCLPLIAPLFQRIHLFNRLLYMQTVTDKMSFL